jgi:hypothetical protein
MERERERKRDMKRERERERKKLERYVKLCALTPAYKDRVPGAALTPGYGTIL